MRKEDFYEESKKFFLDTYWKNDNKKDFYSLNGFDGSPESVYSVFCAEINKKGIVLDLGCGNGLMLKYLMNSSVYRLIPYGVDFLEKSIEQAKTIIHPENRDHFLIQNIVDYNFDAGPFDFIFCAPHHIYSEDRMKFFAKLMANCRKGGKIIFYVYSNKLKNEKPNVFAGAPELKKFLLIVKTFPGLSIAVWENTNNCKDV